jgi:hypothetical protein
MRWFFWIACFVMPFVVRFALGPGHTEEALEAGLLVVIIGAILSPSESRGRRRRPFGAEDAPLTWSRSTDPRDQRHDQLAGAHQKLDNRLTRPNPPRNWRY